MRVLNDEARMTNDETSSNDQNDEDVFRRYSFVIRVWSFLRASSFDIRHLNS
jgi:hypothetical protein